MYVILMARRVRYCLFEEHNRGGSVFMRAIESVIQRSSSTSTCAWTVLCFNGLEHGAQVIGAGVSFNNEKLDVHMVLDHLDRVSADKGVTPGPSCCGRAGA